MTTTLDRPPVTPNADPPSGSNPSPGPTIGVVVAALVVTVGALIGAQPLRDNSFLTHLATGRLILADGVPTTDPYSATAAGEPWVVQSWLASMLYGVADAVAGPVGLRLLMAITVAVLAWLVWRLSDAATSLVPRIGLVVIMLLIGSSAWDPRPLLFGLIGIALVLLAAEGRADPRWMLPTMWLWVNLHGSFPLGIVVAVAWWFGTWWSGRSVDQERRVVAWTVGGALAGAISPLGPKLLLFPVQLLGRSESLREIKEWQSPDFGTTPARLFLLLVVGAIVVLARRPDRRDAVMVVLALGLGLMASRNLGVAALILLPVVARGIGPVGTMRTDHRLPALRMALVAVIAFGLLSVASSLRQPSYALAPYPVRAMAWLEGQDLVGQRQALIVTRDFVGNLQTVLYGADAGVFIDDRYDMYPADVGEDYFTLMDGAGALEVLDRRDVDVVLWDRGSSLAELVMESPDWGVVFAEDRWIVACRRPAPGTPASCTG